MKPSTLTIGLAGILMLAGCVTPNYKTASGENVASLTVTTNTPESWNQQVRFFDGESCNDYPGQLAGLLNSKRAGIDTKESIANVIPAGLPMTVSVYAAVPRDDSFLEMFFKGVQRTAAENRWCEAFVSFVPEQGATYRAAYKIDGAPCSISLMREMNGQGVHVTDAKPSTACSRLAKQKLGDLVLTN